MKKLGFLLLLFITCAAFAQPEPNLARYKTTEQKLLAWVKYCNEIQNAEHYSALLVASEKGIKLSQKHPAFLSKFYYFKGYASEFSNNRYKEALGNYEASLKYAKEARHL